MDVVSILSGAGDDIAGLRDHRRVAVEQTQLAYDLLLESGDGSSMPVRTVPTPPVPSASRTWPAPTWRSTRTRRRRWEIV